MLLSARARDARTGATHVAALLALMAGYALAYRWNTLVPDTARDIVQALAIARGEWPAHGPLIADRWVLGPVWFYVVAALAWLARSPATLALLVGALAAAKIPLAFAVARRFADARGALVFAALVALPGWTVLEHLVWSHTNFVQASALAALLALLRWRERATDVRAFVALLALGLALQTHPTNLVAALPFVAMIDRARLRTSARGMVAGALALALLALPSFMHQFGDAVVDTVSAAALFPSPFAAMRAVPALLLQILLLPQQAPAFLLGEHLPAAAHALRAASAVLAALGLLGASLELLAGRRRTTAMLFAWTLAAIVLVALLRPWTPAYMAFAPQLAASALVAFGLASLLARIPRRAASAASATVVAIALATSAAWIATRMRAADAGIQHLPRMALIDVRQDSAPMDPPNVMFTAADHARVGRATCRGELRVAVAADLAAMLLMGQGAPLALARCAPERWPAIGVDADALAGVPRALATQAGLASDATLASFALVPIVRGVHSAPTRRLEYVDEYPPYHFFELPPESRAWTVDLQPGERLLLSNLLVFFNPWEPAASVAGTPVVAVARSENTLVYACPAAAACSITLSATSRRPDWLQAMVVRTR